MNETPNEWAALRLSLEALSRTGRAEVREDGEWLPDLTAPRMEICGAGSNALIHLWSDRRNLTRRIVQIREQSPERVALDVRRMGRKRPGKLEISLREFQRPAGRVTRAQFGALLRRLLSERFPDSTIDSLTSAADLATSFSGRYVRGTMHQGARAWAFLAASPSENATTIDDMLAFALLWLDWVRDHAAQRAIEGVWLFVPEGKSRSLRERAAALSARAGLRIFECCYGESRIEEIDARDAGNVERRLIPRPEGESAVGAARAAISRLPGLAAKIGQAQERVREIYLPQDKEVAFLFRGLAFARWSQQGLRFGVEQPAFQRKLPLDPIPQTPMELLDQLALRRNPLASETNHRLYRGAPERWLEAVIQDDPSRLDAHLDPRFLYSQVPALAAGDRGVLDLLGVTRRGRLVVIELKATESIQLPIQAADYWLRVRRHQQAADFTRAGYFPGIELSAQPPLVWLVAPALHFHSALGAILRHLDPEIQVTRIGVNENWRRGLRVMFRQTGSGASGTVARPNLREFAAAGS